MIHRDISLEDLTPKCAFTGINHSLNGLQEIAREEERCLTRHHCDTEPLSMQRKMNCHLALQSLMIAKTKNQVYLLALELASDLRLQLFQQFFQLVTTNY